MKKLFLSVIGMYLTLVAAFSQGSPVRDTAYKPRKLSFEEMNIVSSYYHQEGNNAAVTGGIGSEKLTDIAFTIDLKFTKYDRKKRKHSFTTEVGFDHYTSASSDKVDPTTISSASAADNRIYPSLQWSVENEQKGHIIGAGLSYSGEYDYISYGANAMISKKNQNRNGEFTGKVQLYLDNVSLIYPVELRNSIPPGSGFSKRNSFSGSVQWAQIINRQFQVQLEGEVVYQQGYLGLPFHRVYFNDNSVQVEKMPDTRLKIPLGVRASYFIGDQFILRGWYRNYHDSWGIRSNALQLETAIKFTPFFSLTPFYRLYSQTAADHFQPFQVHTVADHFYTSNYDLSDFNSNFFGAGIRLSPPTGVFHFMHFTSFELRYGHYKKTTGMNANIITLHTTFK